MALFDLTSASNTILRSSLYLHLFWCSTSRRGARFSDVSPLGCIVRDLPSRIDCHCWPTLSRVCELTVSCECELAARTAVNMAVCSSDGGQPVRPCSCDADAGGQLPVGCIVDWEVSAALGRGLEGRGLGVAPDMVWPEPDGGSCLDEWCCWRHSGTLLGGSILATSGKDVDS